MKFKLSIYFDKRNRFQTMNHLLVHFLLLENKTQIYKKEKRIGIIRTGRNYVFSYKLVASFL